MSKSEFYIEVLQYAMQHEKINQLFEERDNSDLVTLDSLTVRIDRKKEEAYVFLIMADYRRIESGFSLKEDIVIEVLYNREKKEFVGARWKEVIEIDN